MGCCRQPPPLPVFAFHNCLDALALCPLALQCCFLADTMRPLGFRMAHDITSCQADYLAITSAKSSLPGKLLVLKQYQRQFASAHAKSQATCLCTGRAEGSLPEHRQNGKAKQKAINMQKTYAICTILLFFWQRECMAVVATTHSLSQRSKECTRAW